MGYEIAGGLGVKMARPDREVIVLVGDGSYLMMNSEIATSVMLGLKLTVVVLDNRGFGCIDRLQRATGGRASTTCSDTPSLKVCRLSTSLAMRQASVLWARRRRALPTWKRLCAGRDGRSGPASW
jgi:TPP-dependent trihydroxycyclohexane-1,2-dione (THcHDO) dehydratase